MLGKQSFDLVKLNRDLFDEVFVIDHKGLVE